MVKIPERVRLRKQFTPPPDTAFPPIEPITAPNFKERLLSRFYVRLHMTLMLGAVMISGVSANKLLLELDVNWMLIRYPIAVCVAYGIFFLSIKVWLWYIGVDNRSKDESEDEDLSDFDEELSDLGPPESGSYSLSSSSEGSSFDIAPDIDLDDEAGFVVMILLALVGLLLFGVLGAGIYLIYQSPAILAEAALQAALASGLINATRRIEYGDWADSVLKATWIPFAAVLALAIGFGWAAQHFCPSATKAAEVFYLCL